MLIIEVIIVSQLSFIRTTFQLLAQAIQTMTLQGIITSYELINLSVFHLREKIGKMSLHGGKPLWLMIH